MFPHKMRHTACTLMLMRGMDLFTVSKIMGHTSVLTTQGYLSLLPEDLQAKHATASLWGVKTSSGAGNGAMPPLDHTRGSARRAHPAV